VKYSLNWLLGSVYFKWIDWWLGVAFYQMACLLLRKFSRRISRKLNNIQFNERVIFNLCYAMLCYARELQYNKRSYDISTLCYNLKPVS